MQALRLFILFIVLFIAQVAFGQNCFDVANKPSFMRILDDSRLSDSQRLQAMNSSCDEIKEPFKNFQQTENRLQTKDRAIHGFLRLTGGGPEALMTGMASSPAQIRYRRALDEIKLNPNRTERIRLTYELVVETMGPYEKEMVGNTPTGYGPNNKEYNPANIVDRAALRGSGGICRHHATLLSWSLNYVSRTSNTELNVPANETFKAVTKQGCNGEYCHMWVGVEIPQGSRTEYIDLDSTNYPQVTFLNSKLNGITRAEQTRIQNICTQVTQCLSNLQKNNPGRASGQKLQQYYPPAENNRRGGIR